jgi:phage terminase large subunit GpA-like protein
MAMKQKTINLFRRILKTVAPPLDILPSKWAEQNIVLNESALSTGKWRPDTAPYQIEIINAVKDPVVEKIVIMSASQGGKNVIVNIIIGYFVDIDPCPIMLIEPGLELAEDYSKRRLAPLIADIKVLREKIHEAKSRDSSNTILLKLFPGGSLNLVGANSPRSLASKPIRVVIADEIDGFELSSGKEGDPLKLADRRSTTYWNRKKIYVSTPVLSGVSRIEQEYLKGTQEKWNIECPNCGVHQYINLHGIKFQHEKDSKDNYKVWDITFQCPACLEKYDEYTWKQQPGKWVAYNPAANKVRSFHWNAFIYPWSSWEEIILEWLTVKKDPEQHKVFKNTIEGLPWEETLGQEEYQYLLDRREEYGVELPDGVLLLTAGVDTQDDRLEYEIVGWGRGEQTWGIEYGVIMGKPDRPETWQALSDKLSQVFHFASGIGLRVACTFVDSGGHYTSDVYSWCKKNEHRKIFAIRGMNRPGLPIIHSMGRSKKEGCRYFNLGVDGGKARILSRVQIDQPGDGYCHFPLGDRGYDQTYFRGLMSEYQDKEKKGGKIKLVWKKKTDIRNEPLDVRNYAQAAFYLLPVNWDALESRIKNVVKPKEQMSATNPITASAKGLVKKSNIW